MANKFPIGQSFQRLTNKPLDETTVFNTLFQAQDYAKNNPTSYIGQIIYVRDARKDYEIDDSFNVYGKPCYISLDREVKPICSLSNKSIEVLYDIIEDILDETTTNTKDKLDYFYDIINNKTPSIEYPENPNLPENPDVNINYKDEPWNPNAYNEYQIALKMTQYTTGDIIGNNSSFIIEGANYTVKNLVLTEEGISNFYKIIILDNLPTRVIFDYGTYIEKVIHMCDTSNITNMSNMFSNCFSLIALNMSNFKISDTTNTEKMFENSTLLELSNIDMTGCSEDTIRIITNAYNTSR